jgi:glycine cleavage system H protein
VTKVSETPDNLRYTTDHEWAVLTEGSTVRGGITDYAQASLGDIVFGSVHEIGATVATGDTFGEVESTKSVSDLLSPIAGVVSARNEALDSSPELVNSDPYGAGWIAEIVIQDAAVLDSLLDAEAYLATLSE